MGSRARSRGVESAAEGLSNSAGAVPLAPGACYLIKEKKPDLSYRLFSMLTRGGTPGLVITRQYPERVRRGGAPQGGRVILLSHPPRGDYHQSPPNGSPPEPISGVLLEDQ